MGAAVLKQIDVEAAIVVEVKKGRSGTHDLRHEIRPGRTCIVNKSQTHIRRDIDKPRRLGVLFRGCPGLGTPTTQEQSTPDEQKSNNTLLAGAADSRA